MFSTFLVANQGHQLGLAKLLLQKKSRQQFLARLPRGGALWLLGCLVTETQARPQECWQQEGEGRMRLPRHLNISVWYTAQLGTARAQPDVGT